MIDVLIYLGETSVISMIHNSIFGFIIIIFDYTSVKVHSRRLLVTADVNVSTNNVCYWENVASYCI